MTIGTIFGIPISIFVVYVLVIKPLISLGAQQPTDSAGGKIFTVFSVIAVVFLVLVAVSVVGGILILSTN